MKSGDEKKKRIQRIKLVLGCETDAALGRLLGSYHTRIIAWKQRGFHATIGRLIDALLNVIDELKVKIDVLDNGAKKAKKEREGALCLYAKIKSNSKYANQMRLSGNRPFSVEIVDDEDGYVVAGGPGGQYRLKDVSLFAKSEHSDRLIKIKG